MPQNFLNRALEPCTTHQLDLTKGIKISLKTIHQRTIGGWYMPTRSFHANLPKKSWCRPTAQSTRSQGFWLQMQRFKTTADKLGKDYAILFHDTELSKPFHPKKEKAHCTENKIYLKEPSVLYCCPSKPLFDHLRMRVITALPI